MSGVKPLWAAVLDALPQTQCTRCGYPDCAAYAQAIAQGQAAINRCPPGGAEGIARLAALTGQPLQPLDPACGAEAPREAALIDESACIGCTLCLPVCPTDAIVGSNKRMHTVLERHCTGCALCVPVCPVDCIRMQPVTPGRSAWQAWTPEQAQQARERYASHQQRRVREQAAQALRLEAKAVAKRNDLQGHTQATNESEMARRRAVIDAALARARAQRQAP